MASPDRLDATALACVGVALVTWSSAYAAIAYALAAFTPGEVALARLAIAALCFALLLAVRRVPLPSRREWPALALLGVIGFSIYHLCLNLAETRIASGTASILIALVPAAAAAVAATWMGERLPARTLAGLAVALAGVVLVVLASGKRVRFEPMAALVLVSVLASAIYFVGVKPYFARSSALVRSTFAAATETSGRRRTSVDIHPHSYDVHQPAFASGCPPANAVSGTNAAGGWSGHSPTKPPLRTNTPSAPGGSFAPQPSTSASAVTRPWKLAVASIARAMPAGRNSAVNALARASTISQK